MEQASETEKNTDDPFAADIFASPAEREKRLAETAETEQAATKIKNENLWSRNLPQVRQTEIFFDALQINFLQIFFVEMSEKLSESLTRLLNLPDAQSVEISLADKYEINRAEDFSPENGWWLTAANSGAEIFFQIGDAFAVWLIDTALGARKNFESVVLRPLTAAETAILEYFALNLAHEANLYLQSAQIRYRALSRETPAALQKITGAENFSLLGCEFQTTKNLPPDVFKIYLTPETLKSFSQNENLMGKWRGQIIENLPAQVKNIRARFVCGSTELTFGELAALEKGDVILFENQWLSAAKAGFMPNAEILCGDGDRQKIIGEFKDSDFLRDSLFLEENVKTDNKVSVRRVRFGEQLAIVVKSLAQFENSPPDKFMTETNDNLINENAPEETPAGDEQENGLAVENLVVALRVELEARRLPLSEIAGLRENQTLELSVRPTDEVNILVDDRLIGRGELVLIEDERLGVKIVKLIR